MAAPAAPAPVPPRRWQQPPPQHVVELRAAARWLAARSAPLQPRLRQLRAVAVLCIGVTAARIRRLPGGEELLERCRRVSPTAWAALAALPLLGHRAAVTGYVALCAAAAPADDDRVRRGLSAAAAAALVVRCLGRLCGDRALAVAVYLAAFTAATSNPAPEGFADAWTQIDLAAVRSVVFPGYRPPRRGRDHAALPAQDLAQPFGAANNARGAEVAELEAADCGLLTLAAARPPRLQQQQQPDRDPALPQWAIDSSPRRLWYLGAYGSWLCITLVKAELLLWAAQRAGTASTVGVAVAEICIALAERARRQAVRLWLEAARRANLAAAAVRGEADVVNGEGAMGPPEDYKPWPARDHEEDGCTVCWTNRRDTKLRPCDHFKFCWDCAGRLEPRKCPVCRQNFTQRQFVGRTF
eukprot:TRINITY_DN25472_c0_g1_i2.p2 TRINITY_DN25472_c0_g1~~TRINITY_DN25472_c0_g1_i2.p2  ORF type:complete len:435 (+),score=142.86 TRINITY_DN25472_c0_g1_i2:68-1306(+)